MKRTLKLYKSEHYAFADGTTLDRDEVTVEPIGETAYGKRKVWADVDDRSCLYTYKHGLLWHYDGEVF